MRSLLTVLFLGLAVSVIAEEKKEATVPAALNFKMKSLTGKDVALADYQGKVVLVVNVASQCGLTPQYKGLQALHEKYHDKGLVVLGFPCNQFGAQEPGDATEIQEFCTANYGVKFPMFAKIDVNGPNAAPLYKLLTETDTKPQGKGNISWNFEKFLISRTGEVAARFKPGVEPTSDDFVQAVEQALSSK